MFDQPIQLLLVKEREDPFSLKTNMNIELVALMIYSKYKWFCDESEDEFGLSLQVIHLQYHAIFG